MNDQKATRSLSPLRASAHPPDLSSGWWRACATTPSSCSTRRPRHHVERRRRAIKGYAAPRSSASTSRSSTRRRRSTAAGRSTSSRSRQAGPLRGRRLARAQGRLALLGQRRHHARCATTTASCVGFAKVTRDLTERREHEEAAPERGALPPAGRGRAGLRDLHARPGRPRRELERRRAAHQGLQRRRDHRPALLDVLSARGRGARASPARSWRIATRDGPLRGRRLARAQGRLALLGQRRDHRAVRRRTATLRGFAKVTRDLTERQAARGRWRTQGRQHQRVPRDARARAAQSARADPQRGERHGDERRELDARSAAGAAASSTASSRT